MADRLLCHKSTYWLADHSIRSLLFPNNADRQLPNMDRRLDRTSAPLLQIHLKRPSYMGSHQSLENHTASVDSTFFVKRSAITYQCACKQTLVYASRSDLVSPVCQVLDLMHLSLIISRVNQHSIALALLPDICLPPKP